MNTVLGTLLSPDPMARTDPRVANPEGALDTRAVNRAERHLRAFLRAIASLPGGTLHEETDTRTETGIAWPIFNGGVGGDVSTAFDAGAPWEEARISDLPPPTSLGASR
jgi:hypothetical protein